MAARTCPHHDAVSVHPARSDRKFRLYGEELSDQLLRIGIDGTNLSPVGQTGRPDRRRFQQSRAE